MLDTPGVPERAVFTRLGASTGVDVKFVNKTPLRGCELEGGHRSCIERYGLTLVSDRTACQVRILSNIK